MAYFIVTFGRCFGNSTFFRTCEVEAKSLIEIVNSLRKNESIIFSQEISKEEFDRVNCKSDY